MSKLGNYLAQMVLVSDPATKIALVETCMPRIFILLADDHIWFKSNQVLRTFIFLHIT